MDIMKMGDFTRLLFLLVCVTLIKLTNQEVLNPPYFNIAEGRNITATETCGEKVGKEFFCKIIGSMWTENVGFNQDRFVHQGQACDYCDPSDPKKAHPAEYAIDGSPKWWQSPPLSRGPDASKVNLTIDLGQEFHVAYVYITMANSPRPGVWVLERSTDKGKTYKPWMYFADSREECIKQFGEESVRPLTRDDQVICETKYSKLIPLENGEMVISLLTNRPSGDNFTSSEVLQEFTKATNVRLRFIRPQTTFGHLLNVDQTVTRRYFYSIRDINIGGRCVCNGHAMSCDVINQTEPDKLYCACQHNTDGDQCGKCKPNFVQKRWQPATPDNPFVCEPCNCNGHSKICEFDEDVEKRRESMDIYGKYEGGGRCMHCDHNTTGVNCHECKFGYYRPEGRPLNASDVCVKCKCSKTSHTGGCDVGTGTCQCAKNFTNAPACDKCAYGYHKEPLCPMCPCYRNGTLDEICDPVDGKCECKKSYAGSDCSSCAPDYWGFPECKKCNCDSSGSLEPNCNSTDGQCTCKKQFSGRQCNSCSIGFYNYPECQACNCNPLGTSEEVCDQSDGKCKCKPGFGGERCDECASGYFDFSYCKPCACNLTGSTNATCNKDGKCNCAARYGGLKCNQCAAGYFDFPRCEPCGCDPAGSYGSTCQNGVCQCRDNFEGIKCNKCKKNYYNYPTCESCDCNPAGVVPNFAGCSEIMSGKLCECKERVTGRYCDTCAPHYKNLRSSNPQGCEPCRCNRAGSINGLDYCDGESGQCVCKESVTGLACDRCTYGTYALSVGNYLGCVPCDCDVGGSWRGACDQRTGSCQCKYRIEGRRCDRPQKAHYFYTTYQYLYELEDGRGEYHNVRYDYNETDFPGFSWKGYAKFNKLQKKVIIDFVVIRSSFYRVIFNYHNPGTEPIVGNLTLSNENEPPQHIKVTFPPTSGPKKYLVPMDKTSPLYLFSAQRPWKAALSADEPLLVDYIVFLPQAYFEAAILRENVTAACTISTANYQLCRHYGYTKFPSSAITYPKDAAYTNADPPQDTRDSFLIDATLLSDQEREHVFDLDVEKSQKYVLVFAYVYRVTNPPPKGQVAKLTVEVNTLNGTVNIPFQVPMCQYTFPCRHIVLNEKAAPVEFHLESGSPSVNVKLTNEIGEATFGISGLVFLPKSDWHIDHVKPSLICVMRNLTCLDMSFDSNSESNKITFASQGKVTPVSTSGAEGSTEIQDRTIELVGTAPRTENYQIIVHYYQPDYPSFDIEATFQRTPSSTSEQATLSIAHCPSKSGCRSVVKFKKPLGVLEEGKEFTLILTPPKDRGVTLDYLLLTAEKSFSQTQLELPVVDRSTEFLRHCVQDAFYIDDSFSEFCKQALFTLTTGHNSGGAFCGCNVTGSKGYTCNPLGGQCDCKPNVIGRECKACRSDYYGFPDCKPCNCTPNAAYCEPLTGECVCPKNVVGAACDKCAPLTFGYDSKMGCEKCNCHPTGVKDGNLQCDLNTGKCDCQDKYDGHACDSCKSGYFDFPVCRVCDCHLDGTKADICDRKSGMCDCKENVLRPNCNICRRGTYNLEKSNPQGCTKCFCFGTTENCKSSDMRIAPIVSTNYSNWSAIKVTFTDSGMRINSIETESGSTESQFTIKPVTLDRGDLGDLSSGSEPRSNIYFKLPNEFLGNRITSYGGFIRYEINESPLDGSANSLDTPITPDVIFIGRNSTIALTRDEQPESPGSLKIEIELLETKFVHLSDAASVTRAQLMTLLVDLQAVYIRGSYFEPIESVSLSSFQFDSISNDVGSDAPLALRVEQCFCPANYKGSSCEECASGYYRIPTGPYLGSCIPCHCNGHSNECDPLTGKCFNCMHNTKGDHCELCNSGYYGNATIGTPDDCMMCPCPLPNNFAESCELRFDSRLISEWNCNCKPGYTGQLCEICSAGHFGHPLKAGNYCQPCNCNGNIDPTDPGSCNLYSGECTKCLNNTAGKSCEYCADGYYGDAIELKNCMPCLCDDFGTAVCDRYSGKCDCHPNVIGESCDECKPNYWGFNSRKGCTSCNCSIASQGPDCDLESGQCRCQPGVTGRTCDACEVGFWKYSKSGCISCGCVEKYSRGVVCNQQTGKCECLPGVVGEKCDQCPWRWVFVDREGCLECGECQHALLNDTDALENDVLPMLNEFSNSSSVVFSKTSFVNFNNTESKLNKQLAEIIEASKTIDLSPLEDEMNKMANASDNLPATQEKFHKYAAGVAIKVEETKENATAVRRLIKKVKSEVDSLAQQLNATDYQFDIQANEESIKLMITQAEEKAKAIDYYNWKNKLDSAANESLASITVLEKVKDYISPYVTERTNLNNSKSQLERIETTLKDANNKISDAIKVALDVERNVNLSRKSIKEMLLPKNDAMKNYESAISANLKEAKTRIDESDPILKAGSGSLETLVEISNRITAKKDSLSDVMFKPEDLQESGLLDKVKQATDHANFLNKTAADLDTIFVEAIRQGDLNRTMRAATAYEVIEKSIESAENSMNDVIQRISEKPGWDGIRDKIISTRTASTGNRTEGSTLRANITTSGSSKLKRYNETIRAMAAATAQKFEQLNKIEKGLEEIEVSSIAEPTRNVLDKAEESKYTADRVSEKFDRLVSDVNSLSNATKQLTEEERKAFIDIHESTSMTLLYGERGIAQKIREAMERVTKMVGSVESSKAKLKELKNSVIRARDMANRIDVAMKLTSGSFAELRKPQDLDSSGSYNKLSLNFATNSTDGLLAFIGNVRRAGSSFNKRNTRQIASTRETTDDYMALLLHEGKIRVALDLGSGPQFLETETRINDGSWGNLIVERIGKTLKITVNKDEKEIVTHGHIDGFSSVLDLNTQRSKIFIGSIPNQYIVPDTIKVNEFTGSLAYITLGDTPLGLLNFHQGVYLSGENLPNQPQVKGIHFNGLGWASTKIETDKLSTITNIVLTIKTYARSGLILLLSGTTDFLAIQLDNGQPKVIIDLGSGYVSIVHPKKVNDGNEHTIAFSRKFKDITLGVQGEETMSAETSGSQATFELDPTLYIGGHPGKHGLPEVSETPYEGCFNELGIEAKLIELGNATMMPGVTAGCLDSGVREAVFESNSPSYIAMPLSIEITEGVQISFKFRTNESNGLLFFASSSLSNNPFSFLTIYISDGTLALRTEPGKTIESSGIRYDDNEWHYVMATKNAYQLRMDIDDKIEIALDSSDVLSISPGTFYIGGAPESLNEKLNSLQIPSNFVGCLGDAVVHDKFQDLKKAQSVVGATLVTCKIISDGKPRDSLPPPKSVVTVSSTTIEPTSETPEPPSLCHKPFKPVYPSWTIASTGRRFGTWQQSRAELKLSPEIINSFITESNVTLEFKTHELLVNPNGTRNDGVIFFLADAQYVDLFTLYMKQGSLFFAWNAGSGTETIGNVEKRLNMDDGKWHKITFGVKLKQGKLSLSNGETLTGTSPGGSSNLNIISPAYIGGLPPGVSERIKGLLEGVTNSFPGCIRNVVIGQKQFSFAESETENGHKFFSAPPCSEELEMGSFFPGQSNYLTCYDKFKVGASVEINFMIKPRNVSGLLLASFGVPDEKNRTTDYLIAKMVEGTIIVTVNNGAGAVNSQIKIKNAPSHTICDGKWHKVKIVKVQNAHYITVDEDSNVFEFGPGGVNVADTLTPLYVGDVPDKYRRLFPDLPQAYIGCMKNFKISRPLTQLDVRKTDLNWDCQNSGGIINLCPLI